MILLREVGQLLLGDQIVEVIQRGATTGHHPLKIENGPVISVSSLLFLHVVKLDSLERG